MEFTNFDQMNQMIVTACWSLGEILVWLLSALALGLSLCGLAGALGLGWREARQTRRQPQAQTLFPTRTKSVYAARWLTALK